MDIAFHPAYYGDEASEIIMLGYEDAPHDCWTMWLKRWKWKARKSEEIMWDERYSANEYIFGKEPNEFLAENYKAVKRNGR